MRRSFASLLIALSITLGMPAVGSAQAGRSAILSGQIVDAGGRGSSGRTVELVSDGLVVGVTTSSYDGIFSFALSGSGTYVVRTFANGHAAGIRVSVVRGQNPPMALLVLPSIVTSSAQAGVFISSAVSALASISSIAASVAVTTLVTTVSEKNDDEILSDPQTRQEVLALLTQIVQQVTNNPNATFTPGQQIPGLPPDVTAAFDQIINNVPAASLGG